MLYFEFETVLKVYNLEAWPPNEMAQLKHNFSIYILDRLAPCELSLAKILA